jgi:hypothetical protein
MILDFGRSIPSAMSMFNKVTPYFDLRFEQRQMPTRPGTPIQISNLSLALPFRTKTPMAAKTIMVCLVSVKRSLSVHSLCLHTLSTRWCGPRCRQHCMPKRLIFLLFRITPYPNDFPQSTHSFSFFPSDKGCNGNGCQAKSHENPKLKSDKCRPK